VKSAIFACESLIVVTNFGDRLFGGFLVACLGLLPGN
jgi:hypothetical protein